MKFFILCGLIGLLPALALGESSLASASPRNILVLGDSLAAGYGVDPDEAFPALIQKKIDAQGLNAKIINAGLSGDTSAGGLRRLDWLLKQKVDLLPWSSAATMACAA